MQELLMPAGATLVVVADGAVARFLSRARPGARLVELVDLNMLAEPSEGERDRAPRVQDSVGGRRHKIERRLTAHEAAEKRFLSQVMDRVVQAFRANLHASLVICAPPRALGVLRGALPADIRERLVLSLGKDVTKETPRDLDERLKDLHV
jgi:protein required for attachment to host cells